MNTGEGFIDYISYVTFIKTESVLFYVRSANC
jgi:hypothetical protein